MRKRHHPRSKSAGRDAAVEELLTALRDVLAQSKRVCPFCQNDPVRMKACPSADHESPVEEFAEFVEPLREETDA